MSRPARDLDDDRPGCAVIVGATGGLGRALTALVAAGGRYEAVHAWSRSGEVVVPGVHGAQIELADEGSIADAGGRMVGGPPLGLAIVATGLLHRPNLRPEKSWRDLDATALAASFAVNVIGPALLAKHLVPLMKRRGRSVFAALSARVGSISDNRLGGWYGYRSSKAALNQILRTLAIELSRTRPDAICLGLHPGTVATELSEPFLSAVAAEQLFSPQLAAQQLLDVIDRATPAESGLVLDWAGKTVPP